MIGRVLDHFEYVRVDGRVEDNLLRYASANVRSCVHGSNKACQTPVFGRETSLLHVDHHIELRHKWKIFGHV